MAQQINRLRLCSYNSNGSGFDRQLYIKDLFRKCDIILLQEHWLYTEHINILTSDLQNANICGTSAMNQNELRRGRPFGGTAILWRSDSRYKVTPMETMNDRISCVRLEIDKVKLLVFNVYMPCDGFGPTSKDKYDDILLTISSICDTVENHALIIGGDFNADLSRLGSLNTKALFEFLQRENLHCLTQQGNIDYSFKSRMSHERSLIDHFFISEIISNHALHCYVQHDALNFSDHSPVFLDIDIGTTVSMCNVTNFDVSTEYEKLLWDKATQDDIDNYKKTLDEILSCKDNSSDFLFCRDIMCTNCQHKTHIEGLYNYLIDASVFAGRLTIPTSTGKSPRKNAIHGWNAYIRDKRDKAIFWHDMWKNAGSPKCGVVADIRRSTRAQYHRAVKQVKKNQDTITMTQLAESLYNSNVNCMWSQIKRMCSRKSAVSPCIDDAYGSDIANVFKDKYSLLYKSVPLESSDIDEMKKQIEEKVNSKCLKGLCYCDHKIKVGDVRKATQQLKRGKHDAYYKLYSDHYIHSSHRFQVLVSLLVNLLLSHNVIPNDLSQSVLIPIPKDKKKSLNTAKNYRAIALSSIMGKIIDLCMLRKHCEVFSTNDLQFGFKSEHSAVQCTFAVKEIVQYYNNKKSNVHMMLLDACQAFDRVSYSVLFQLLLKKELCPVAIRFLLQLYTHQQMSVRWINHESSWFSIQNGVRQGGVLSPTLFAIYVDELF